MMDLFFFVGIFLAPVFIAMNIKWWWDERKRRQAEAKRRGGIPLRWY
jgi:hypothetical protein